MLNYEEELKKYHPSMDVNEAEDAIYSRDLTDVTDILRESGVDTDFVTVGDGPSGHAVIQVDPSGQNCILLFGGCNQEITHAEIDRVLARFQAGDYLKMRSTVWIIS